MLFGLKFLSNSQEKSVCMISSLASSKCCNLMIFSLWNAEWTQKLIAVPTAPLFLPALFWRLIKLIHTWLLQACKPKVDPKQGTIILTWTCLFNSGCFFLPSLLGKLKILEINPNRKLLNLNLSQNKYSINLFWPNLKSTCPMYPYFLHAVSTFFVGWSGEGVSVCYHGYRCSSSVQEKLVQETWYQLLSTHCCIVS